MQAGKLERGKEKGQGWLSKVYVYEVYAYVCACPCVSAGVSVPVYVEIRDNFGCGSLSSTWVETGSLVLPLHTPG